MDMVFLSLESPLEYSWSRRRNRHEFSASNTDPRRGTLSRCSPSRAYCPPRAVRQIRFARGPQQYCDPDKCGSTNDARGNDLWEAERVDHRHENDSPESNNLPGCEKDKK